MVCYVYLTAGLWHDTITYKYDDSQKGITTHIITDEYVFVFTEMQLGPLQGEPITQSEKAAGQAD